MLDRFGIRHGRRVLTRVGRDELAQQPPRPPLVCGVVIDLERGELPGAQRQVHPARPDSLRVAEQLRVEGGLRHGPALHRSGELRVDHLVVHPLRARLAVRHVQQPGANQEIRTSQQGRCLVPEQHTLVDHVDTAPDGAPRGLRRVGLRCLRDLDDMAPVRPEPVEHGPFVSLAPLDELPESDVELMRRMQLAPRPQQVQPRQMLTGQDSWRHRWPPAAVRRR